MRFFPCLVALFALSDSAPAQTAPASRAPSAVLGSTIFPWDSSAAQPTKTGTHRDVFNAPTATLDKFHCHISTLNPGETTGAPHRHPQEELVILKEGTLEVNIAGKIQTVTTGAMIFYAANELENMRNVGTTPATYYVLQFFTALTPKT
jgi:XRE family transcriptional regulator, regulator of sulfur utilization